MQVNLFVTGASDQECEYQLLVLPFGADAEIPSHLQHLAWRHLAVTDLADRLLSKASPIVEAQLGSEGFALLTLAQ